MPPDVAAGTADLVTQLQDHARALGLVWSMRKATVADGTDPAAVTAVIDGDVAAVSMVSMVGPLPSATRVWVMVVPSGGNYITGRVNDATQTRYLGGQLCNNSTAASSTLTTEVAIPSATWNSEPTYRFEPGRMFKVTASYEIAVSISVSTVAFVHIRKGQATTTGTVLAGFLPHVFLNSNASFVTVGYFANTSQAAISDKLSLTVTRVSGAATVSLSGTQGSGDQRAIIMAVEEIGPATLPGLSGLVAIL